MSPIQKALYVGVAIGAISNAIINVVFQWIRRPKPLPQPTREEMKPWRDQGERALAALTLEAEEAEDRNMDNGCAHDFMNGICEKCGYDLESHGLGMSETPHQPNPYWQARRNRTFARGLARASK